MNKSLGLTAKRLACALVMVGIVLAPLIATHAAVPSTKVSESTRSGNFGEHVKHDAAAVGAAVKEAAHRVGVAIKAVAHEVAGAARRGAAATRKAIKGEKIDTSTAESSR